MSRFDDPDALLTLLLVAGAWALTRGIDSGRLRWLVLSAALVGLGFETKFLQAWLVLPAFGLVALVGGAGAIGRRLGHLLVAGITVLLASGWWVAAVEAIPLTDRPFIGGSTTGGPLELLLGYDGLGRIVGAGAGPGGVFAGAGTMFGGHPRGAAAPGRAVGGRDRLAACPWQWCWPSSGAPSGSSTGRTGAAATRASWDTCCGVSGWSRRWWSSA